jgi:hypothetical protein
LLALAKTIRFADKLDDVGFVGQAIQQGDRQPFISKQNRMPQNWRA